MRSLMTKHKVLRWTKGRTKGEKMVTYHQEDSREPKLPRAEDVSGTQVVSLDPYNHPILDATFSHRLHRACLKRALRVITNPGSYQGHTPCGLRFMLCFSNQRQLFSHFQELSKHNIGESLEDWNYPFFRIGGAGTHYPRLDDQGKSLHYLNVHSPAKALQLALPRMGKASNKGESVEKMLKTMGLEGDWFDAHDVEQYVHEKGIAGGQGVEIHHSRAIYLVPRGGPYKPTGCCAPHWLSRAKRLLHQRVLPLPESYTISRSLTSVRMRAGLTMTLRSPLTELLTLCLHGNEDQSAVNHGS
jgi:hypothetical protein